MLDLNNKKLFKKILAKRSNQLSTILTNFESDCFNLCINNKLKSKPKISKKFEMFIKKPRKGKVGR